MSSFYDANKAHKMRKSTISFVYKFEYYSELTYARVKCYMYRVIGDPQLSIIDSDRRTFAVMKTWSLPYT
jgi:hypothetical protein